MRSAQRKRAAWTAAAAAAVAAGTAGTAAGQYVELTASDGGPSQWFGRGVSVWGDVLLAGAPFASAGGQDDVGAVYVFERIGGDWSQTAKLAASDAEEWGGFGWALAAEADLAVVGAQSGDPAVDGKAYVLQRSADGWSEVATLLPSDGRGGFGCSVALSGSRTLIGADWHSLGRGSAYIFEQVAGEWTEVAILAPPPENGIHAFGRGVALRGDIGVVGAPYYPALGSKTGEVFIFEPVGGVWTRTARLTASDAGSNQLFGWSVALDGDTLLIGSPRASGGKGAAYVFEREDEGWTEVAQFAAADGRVEDNFGWAVALAGDTAVVGMPGDGATEGSIYVYRRDQAGAWSLRTKVELAGSEAYDEFGGSLAIGGGHLVVGAMGVDNYTGSVYAAPAPVERSADLNHDGRTNTLDVIVFLNGWARGEEPADWDWNWRIDTQDVLAFLNDWASGT